MEGVEHISKPFSHPRCLRCMLTIPHFQHLHRPALMAVVLLYQPADWSRHAHIHHLLLQGHEGRTDYIKELAGEARSTGHVWHADLSADDRLRSACTAMGRQQVCVGQRPHHCALRGVRDTVDRFYCDPDLEAGQCDCTSATPEAKECCCSGSLQCLVRCGFLYHDLLSAGLVSGMFLDLANP